MWPKISVIMPSLNQRQYIEEAIVSVLEQNYANLEFIILDAASTDGTLDIIKKYSDYLAYWQSKSDNGQTDALIEGFRRSSGELLCWVNSDDILLPNTFHSVVSTYKEHSGAGIFYGDYVLIDSLGRIQKCKRVPRKRIEWFANRGYWVFNSTGTVFTRKAYNIVGGLNGELNYVMDADLFMRMILNGVRCRHVAAYVGGFRRHEDAKTVSGFRDSRQEYLKTANKYWPKDVAANRNQRRWKVMYWLYQMINGNVRMFFDTLMYRSKYWHDCELNNKEQYDYVSN